MAWKIEFESAAKKDLKRLDRQAQKNILQYLRNRISTDEDPCRFGKPLTKKLSGLWKYRIGDYRLICDIRKEKMIVLVLRVGHRSKVYGGH